jgi:Prophage tail length tape measure protein
MGSDKRVGITLEYKTKGAKEAEAGTRGVTNAVEDLTAKLKKADFTPFDSLAKKLQRAEFGGGASGATAGMAAARKEMSLTAFEATQLSYQLNDVFVSLAGGQKPLMVLIQQGSQITGLFGGIGATFMRLTPLVLQWAPALAAAAASAGALYAVLKAPSIGNDAAKKIADIGDAADRAKVSSDRLQAVMKAIVEAGRTPAAEVKDAAENAINRLRETILAAKKAQVDATKGKPSFAKRMSVPGPGEDPFEKAEGSQSGSVYKTVRPTYQDKSPQPVKGEPSLGKVEIDKPDIPRPGAKKSAPQEGPAPDLTKINTPFPGLDDVASKLKVDVRDLDGTLPSLLKFLERISKAFAQVKDEAQKLELSIDLDKALTVPISKLVQSGNLDALRTAFSGAVDETEKFSKPQVDQSQRIRNQDELNQYRQDIQETKQKAPLLNAAEAANNQTGDQITKNIQNVGLLDQAYRLLGDTMDRINKIKAGDQKTIADNPALSTVVSAVQSMNAAKDTVSQKGAEALAQATSEAGQNSQALKDGLAAGDAVAKALADDANRAADALGRAADNAARIKVPDTSAVFDPSGGSGNSGYAEGGFVSGPGTSTSDSIPAMLSDGEFVVRAAKVGQPGVLGFLRALNGGVSLPSLFGRRRFAEGGLVGGLPFAGAAAGGGQPVHVHFDGVSIGPLHASRSVVDQLLREESKRRVSSAGRAPSRVG